MISDFTNQIATAADEQTVVASEINESTDYIRSTAKGFTDNFTASLDEARILKEQAAHLAQLIDKYRHSA